jgi:hypothetical protein
MYNALNNCEFADNILLDIHETINHGRCISWPTPPKTDPRDELE